MGAPTKYEPRFCKMLVEHMTGGLSFESFAGEINVAISTIYLWRESHDEFSEAFKTGYPKCLAFWEKLGLTRVAGKTKRFKEATYNYNMNNRFKEQWKNTMHVTKEPDKSFDPDAHAVIDVTPEKKDDTESKIKAIIGKLKNEY